MIDKYNIINIQNSQFYKNLLFLYWQSFKIKNNKVNSITSQSISLIYFPIDSQVSKKFVIKQRDIINKRKVITI